MIEEIKQIRDDMSLTQAEFAELIGVSVDTVKSWECGRKSPKASNVEKIMSFGSGSTTIKWNKDFDLQKHIERELSTKEERKRKYIERKGKK